MCSRSRKTAERPSAAPVGADALEDADAIVEGVREDVDLGVVPVTSLPSSQIFSALFMVDETCRNGAVLSTGVHAAAAGSSTRTGSTIAFSPANWRRRWS